jgi:hypothetical protein
MDTIGELTLQPLASECWLPNGIIVLHELLTYCMSLADVQQRRYFGGNLNA